MDHLLRDVETILSDTKSLDILCIVLSEPKLARLLKISRGHERFTGFIRSELHATISLNQLEGPPSEPSQTLVLGCEFQSPPPETSPPLALSPIISNTFPGAKCELVDVKLGSRSEVSTDLAKEYHIVTVTIPHITIVENICDDRHIINGTSVMLRVHGKLTQQVQPSETARCKVSAGPCGCLVRICCCSTNHNVINLNFDKSLSPVTLSGSFAQHYVVTTPGSHLSISIRCITPCKITIFLTGQGSVIR